ncbi:hypothetical protein ACA910_020950 [Epithemia clementina (nom. ined.)]
MFGLLFRQIYANRNATTTAKQDPTNAVSQTTQDGDDETVAMFALDFSMEVAKHKEDGGDAEVVFENDNVADTASVEEIAAATQATIDASENPTGGVHG